MKISFAKIAIGVVMVVCAFAVQASAEYVEQLIDALQSKDAKTRDAAASALKEMGPEGMPALTRILREAHERNDEAVMQIILDAIGAQGSAAVPPLLRVLEGALKTGDETMKAIAVVLLQEAGKKDARPLLVALKDCMSTTRTDDLGLTLANVLMKVGPDPLIEVRRDPKADPEIKRVSVLLLSRMAARGDEKALEGLTEALNDKDERVRGQAGNALIDIRDEKNPGAKEK